MIKFPDVREDKLIEEVKCNVNNCDDTALDDFFELCYKHFMELNAK